MSHLHRGRRHIAVAVALLLSLSACGADAPEQAADRPSQDPPQNAPAATQEPVAQGPAAQGPVPQGPGAPRPGEDPAPAEAPPEAADGEVVAVPQDGQLHVKMVDIAFEPDRIELEAGQPVALTVTNEGALEHDLDLPAAALHVHGYPGTQQTALLQIDQPGTYQALCLTAGHADAGMVIDVVVKPAR